MQRPRTACRLPLPAARVDVFQQEAREKYPALLYQALRFPKKLEQALLLGGREGVPNYCGLAYECFEGWDAGREYVFPRGCDNTEHTPYPNPKTTRGTTLLSRVEQQILPGRRDMDLFSLIRATNPTKVKTGSRPRAAHEVPLLTVTANRVIEMEDLATATDSSGVPSTIESSPLDFTHEDPSIQLPRPKDQEATVPEVPPPENVTTTGVAPEAGQAERVATTKRTRERKSLAAIELGMGSIRSAPASQGAHVDVGDPDPLSFAGPQSRPSADVTQSSKGAAAAGDPDSENTSFASMVGSPESIYRPKWGITDGSMLDAPEACQDLVSTLQEQVSGEEKLKAAFEEFKQYEDNRVEQRCAEMDVCLDALSIDFDEELYSHMLTAIAGRRWMIGRGLRLAVMKCDEFTELRQAFADVIVVYQDTWIAKGMSEGLKQRVEDGQAKLDLEAIEAYNPEVEAKYIVALHALKNLKNPLVDQLESLKDAPMDVIMASLHLESDTRDDAPHWVYELHPSSSQLMIPVYPEVHDPMDPWACKEEILLADAIVANVSRAKKKKKC
uniref:Transposase (Putative), gypsy type n=1 Tax=Tanacetum cinerariifolium TaxID=118510 RepID=A0A6L2N2L6_TANCI|nr:hypothetical protein [Tanacetum cinerariifolium]